jgi:hypothetical protein
MFTANDLVERFPALMEYKYSSTCNNRIFCNIIVIHLIANALKCLEIDLDGGQGPPRTVEPVEKKNKNKKIRRIKIFKTCLETGTCGNLLFAGLPAVRQCAPEDRATGQLDTCFLGFSTF